ncbi:acetyl esterase/lipase [Mucilaginibacter yixingensis]|uniref:Acetyl esterase/lipase n=1 Tax=Mucilaginibacter yixingensis TaxID=1295612 RepID=A0A2T5JD48_9SPHI|nr:alpha/beta hydrolase [Mucilaginibacter yixingensis]PTQ99691.1 acetyl esterase/lipase [Mucilaginibacter yixingensis]
MKKILTTITLAMLAMSVFAQQQQKIIIKLWPNGAPTNSGLTGPEQQLENGRVGNITDPTLTVYPAKKGNGMAIITCPGGAYIRLAMNHEGYDMADWFNAQGITYAVLKYRMPNGHPEVPLDDAQQAIKLMRQHAAEWGVDPNKVGIMGNSAGGHLASSAATHFTSDKDRPNFQILFYPVIEMKSGSGQMLLGKQPSAELMKKFSNDQQVTAQTPPAFIACSADDHSVPPVDNAIKYFSALTANKVPAALHVYPVGGHGWGYNDSFIYKREWTEELEKWLRELYK